ncbi:MAG: hypothetical protein ACKVKG_13615 [Alphaproteobacteria bacterium]
MLKIATLGPTGTNHELVTRRYMAVHDIDNYEIVLAQNFHEAADWLNVDAIDAIVQCAVHPETPQTLGAHFKTFYAADCFIADSRELGIVTRNDVLEPKELGILLPANANYVDTSRWSKLRNVPSLPLIGDLLVAGEIDSGLTYTAYAEEYPETLRVDQVIGSPDDVWIVYMRRRASSPGGIVASRDGPAVNALKRMAE